ncbi:ACT11D09.5 [Cucumis melo var. makuwa]|uniref:ACT11D09.5 n=1 Tax=Cucumis melo var. makuwa TaxID=1194695 RepID=A0A5D3C544_CUCMM|nr:ACT11D09.5 [Cucumis melo var. makuwa]
MAMRMIEHMESISSLTITESSKCIMIVTEKVSLMRNFIKMSDPMKAAYCKSSSKRFERATPPSLATAQLAVDNAAENPKSPILPLSHRYFSLLLSTITVHLSEYVRRICHRQTRGRICLPLLVRLPHKSCHSKSSNVDFSLSLEVLVGIWIIVSKHGSHPFEWITRGVKGTFRNPWKDISIELPTFSRFVLVAWGMGNDRCDLSSFLTQGGFTVRVGRRDAHVWIPNPSRGFSCDSLFWLLDPTPPSIFDVVMRTKVLKKVRFSFACSRSVRVTIKEFLLHPHFSDEGGFLWRSAVYAIICDILGERNDKVFMG